MVFVGAEPYYCKPTAIKHLTDGGRRKSVSHISSGLNLSSYVTMPDLKTGSVDHCRGEDTEPEPSVSKAVRPGSCSQMSNCGAQLRKPREERKEAPSFNKRCAPAWMSRLEVRIKGLGTSGSFHPQYTIICE